MLAAFRDPLFVRHSDWQPCTEGEARNYLADAHRAFDAGSQVDVAVAETTSAEFVLGGASLNNIDLTQGRASVGYWLTPQARGRGVTTRAVHLITRWAFDEVRLDRLELTCAPDNVASQRVAERCGFRREGLLRAHVPFKGGRRDTVVFGLLRSDR